MLLNYIWQSEFSFIPVVRVILRSLDFHNPKTFRNELGTFHYERTKLSLTERYSVFGLSRMGIKNLTNKKPKQKGCKIPMKTKL